MATFYADYAEEMVEWLHFMLILLDILILNQTFGNNRENFKNFAVNSRDAANR